MTAKRRRVRGHVVRITRDYQRRRVYSGDHALVSMGRKKFADISAAQQRLLTIMRSKWWRQRFPDLTGVTVREDATMVDAGSVICFTADIRLSPTEGMHPAILLHELAHVAIDHELASGRLPTLAKAYSPHGPEFCAVYAALVRRWMGVRAWRKLIAAWDIDGVEHFELGPGAVADAIEARLAAL